VTNLTLDDVEQLPPTVGLLTAARMLGVGRTAAYELVRTGTWPTPVLRLGRAIRIPTAPLLVALGVHPRPSSGTSRILGFTNR